MRINSESFATEQPCYTKASGEPAFKMATSNQNHGRKRPLSSLKALGLFSAAFLVWVSAARGQNVPTINPTCVCDPLCQIYPDESNPNSCRHQVARPDCPCCTVCAAELGESCDTTTHPCDVTQGLECHPEENVCKGKTARAFAFFKYAFVLDVRSNQGTNVSLDTFLWIRTRAEKVRNVHLPRQ